MIFHIEFLRKSRIELIAAWEWYEDKQPGLGDKFKHQIDLRINEIERNPKRYPERKKNYREAIVKGFPYLIIYRVQLREKKVAIVSIFHTSRSPEKKRK